MTPTIVHRYAFPIREAIEALLGDAVGDCEAWRIRVEGDEVVIDVVAPAPGLVPTLDEVTSLADTETSGRKPGRAAQAQAGEKPGFPADAKAGETSPDVHVEQDPEPELKGGPLARRAAIMCTERAFWTFSDTSSADEAAVWLRETCGVTSRKMLDHDERAGREFDQIDGRYRRWLQGYDD